MAVRAINASRFAEILEQWKKDCLQDNDQQSADVISDVILQLDDMPTLTPPNEWVSVEDRLPEDDTSEYKAQIAVLVLTDRESIKIKKRTYHPGRVYYGKFYPERWDWGTFNDDRITHWMLLPAPPEKEE